MSERRVQKAWRRITPLQSDVYQTVKFYGTASTDLVAKAVSRPRSQVFTILNNLVARDLLTLNAYGYSVRWPTLY